MDSVLTVWIIYGWLRSSRASQVSPFVSFPPFVIQTLDLELSGYDLDPIALTAGSNDSMGYIDPAIDAAVSNPYLETSVERMKTETLTLNVVMRSGRSGDLKRE